MMYNSDGQYLMPWSMDNDLQIDIPFSKHEDTGIRLMTQFLVRAINCAMKNDLITTLSCVALAHEYGDKYWKRTIA